MNVWEIYSKLPIPLQNMLCSVKGIMLNRERYGGEYKDIFNQLCDSENWTEEQILSYKTEHIASIIRYAYNHVPFYKKWYDEHNVHPDDFKSLEDLSKFPILTKDIIRKNWKDMVSDEYSKKDLILYHTSGSTGTPLDFYWTKHSTRFYWAVVWRGRARFGIERGDLHFNFTGKIVVPITQQKPPYWRFNSALNQYMINQQHITPEKIGSIVEILNQKNPKFFVGYPSIIHSFASMIEELNLKVEAKVKYIFTSAEKMYDFQKEVIERVFPGVKTIEHYGFSENAAAASIALDGYYHEDFELGHLELSNPTACDDGITGEMLATGFQNRGMPFIRYKIGDSATFKDSIRIVRIDGRNEDYIVTPEGARFKRTGYLYKGNIGIKEAQIVQEAIDSLAVNVVPRENADKFAIEQSLKAAVAKWVSPKMKVRVVYVKEIERTVRGKFKAIVSKIGSNGGA